MSVRSSSSSTGHPLADEWRAAAAACSRPMRAHPIAVFATACRPTWRRPPSDFGSSTAASRGRSRASPLRPGRRDGAQRWHEDPVSLHAGLQWARASGLGRSPGALAPASRRRVRSAGRQGREGPRGEHSDRRSSGALAQGLTGAGVVVGIIDTGVDYAHRDLGGGDGPAFKVIGGYDSSQRRQRPPRRQPRPARTWPASSRPTEGSREWRPTLGSWPTRWSAPESAADGPVVDRGDPEQACDPTAIP